MALSVCWPVQLVAGSGKSRRIVQGVSPFGNDFESKRLDKGQKNPENAWISRFGLLCHSRLFPVVCNALQHCNKLCITGSRFGRFTYLTWGYSHSICNVLYLVHLFYLIYNHPNTATCCGILRHGTGAAL